MQAWAYVMSDVRMMTIRNVILSIRMRHNATNIIMNSTNAKRRIFSKKRPTWKK